MRLKNLFLGLSCSTSYNGNLQGTPEERFQWLWKPIPHALEVPWKRILVFQILVTLREVSKRPMIPMIWLLVLFLYCRIFLLIRFLIYIICVNLCESKRTRLALSKKESERHYSALDRINNYLHLRISTLGTSYNIKN